MGAPEVNPVHLSAAINQLVGDVDSQRQSKNKAEKTSGKLASSAESGSGWESNPPGPFSEATLGLKPSTEATELSLHTADTEAANRVLPFGLPESLEDDADFTHLMARWPNLPAHVRQTILTLIASVADAAE